MVLRMMKILYSLYMLYLRLKYDKALNIKSKHVRLRSLYMKPESLLSIAKDSIVNAKIFFDKESSIINIGERVYIGNSTIICAQKIDIENDVMISWGCTIVDHDSHSLDAKDRKNDVSNWINGNKNWDTVKTAPVVIESNAWLGFNVTVLKGVRIGKGAVIAACSVVVKDVEPYTLVAGNPAKVVKVLEKEETI